MTPLTNQALRLVLKSGNFGQEDFFTRALEMTNSRDTMNGRTIFSPE